MIINLAMNHQKIDSLLKKYEKCKKFKQNTMDQDKFQNLKKHKKGALSCLIQNFSIDSIQKMINSPEKRKIIQRQTEPSLSQKKYQSSKTLNKNQLNDTLFLTGNSSQIIQNITTIKKSTQQILNNKNINSLQNPENLNSRQQYYENLSTISTSFSSQDEKHKKKSLKSNIQLTNYHQKYQIKSYQKCQKQENYQVKFIQQSLQPIQSFDGNREELDFKKNLTIDDFVIISLLGKGIYGQVSLVRHKKTNMIMALKKILKKSISSDDFLYLTRQIKIQTFSENPNIVQLYSFFHDEENIYLVLELCNEGNLLTILQQSGGKITEDKVKKYIRQICKAVQFLHNNDIIHRDLKPENILVHNGVAKICDFGWAVHSPQQLRDTLCGTPLYSCPELVKKQKYDKKIDIWCIGILTFQLIFGHVPFEIATHQDMYKVVLQDLRFPQNVNISEDGKNFISGCLQKNPQNRFEIWELLVHPFLKDDQNFRASLRSSLTQRKF